MCHPNKKLQALRGDLNLRDLPDKRTLKYLILVFFIFYLKVIKSKKQIGGAYHDITYLVEGKVISYRNTAAQVRKIVCIKCYGSSFIMRSTGVTYTVLHGQQQEISMPSSSFTTHL